MKKMCVLLALLLALGGVAMAEADRLDDRLDAAFAVGRVELVPATLPMPDLATCELAVPEEFWQMMGAGELPESTLRDMLADAGFLPVSISPDGTHMAGWLSAEGSVVPVAVSPNRVAILCPTTRRGVEDQYGNMEQTYSQAFLTANRNSLMNMGQEGMSWSPDGRYFCSINATQLYKYIKLSLCNPIIVDTETGEMFLLDTYESKFTAPNSGGIITGCFSEDGRSYYALFYGSGYENRCVLLRFDLETGEKELSNAGLEFNGYPSLSELRDGGLLTISDQMKRDQSQSLAVMTPGGNTTFARMPAAVNTWHASYTGYSGASGWLVVRGSFANGSLGQKMGFQRLRPDESLTDGMETVWMVQAQTRTVAPVDMAALSELIARNDPDGLQAFTRDYLDVFDVKLSPDGRYAAVLILVDMVPQLLIVRMEDMATLPAEGIGFQKQALMPGNANTGVFWSDAGLLVSSDGETFGLWQVK